MEKHDFTFQLDRISKYRDRFSAWCLVVAFISLIIAIWIRSPSLEVKIPLIAGADININMGLILAFGPALIAIAQAWVLIPLTMLHRHQHALSALISKKHIPNESELIEACGPESYFSSHKSFWNAVSHTAIGFRYFIFFILPFIGTLWTTKEYFSNLYFLDKQAEISNLVELYVENKGDLDKAGLSEKRRVVFTDYFFSNDISGNARFTISAGALEKPCAHIWLKKEVDKKIRLQPNNIKDLKGIQDELKELVAGKNCAVDNFPAFQLLLNSMINIISLVFSLCLSITGWKIYSQRGGIKKEIQKLPPEKSE